MSLADATDFTSSAVDTDAHHDDLPSRKEVITVWSAIALIAALWATSVAMFGIPGLYMPAVALVPVVFLALVVISRG
ncbi:hypothetical protein J7382_18455 [Shimia sp. R11_0]|uniref:Uncharacterized protein n=1 Tax=Shimia marina TaxID=321267 RepID=A0A0P1EQ47_9RHOB|nr:MULTISPECIES: hypothetical protein [Shimia]MBO9479532.1 hypothetical protein [Shimia sp. R11_0]CUH52553.1 hypothetical protein SHM7688_02000 [Shimia marina]SFE49843.1 hypothetical protein SAMN04488037_11056 [Shimia marina]